jgi:hypothetical protein
MIADDPTPGSRTGCVPRVAALGVLFALASGTVGAQPLQEIGTTSVGNPVLLEKGSVKRDAQGIVTATVRVRFVKPVKTPQGEWRSSRTIARFDCAKQVVAVKENWYFFDDAGKKEASHKVVGVPGFGPAIKGSLPDVAMKHLCAR